jgi:hypothetical protein
MAVATAQKHLAEKAGLLRGGYHVDTQTIFELRLELATPLMISESKADIPVPGLPNLDGILQFAAFYWCVGEATADHPELSGDYLWQVNEALRTPDRNWIDFPIPLREISIRNTGIGKSRRLYDCSVGLPVDPESGAIVYPIGNDLLDAQGERFKRVVDNIPLRRRSVDPRHCHKQIALTAQFDPKRGAHKALDNRMYNLVTNEYRFYFRGDQDWVDRLLGVMRDDEIGIGKKSSLGYGQIKRTHIYPAPRVKATLGHSLTEAQKKTLNVSSATRSIALLKNIPTDELFRWCATSDSNNQTLLGDEAPKILSIVPMLAGYTPPHWLKENQALVARYGSLLYGTRG